MFLYSLTASVWLLCNSNKSIFLAQLRGGRSLDVLHIIVKFLLLTALRNRKSLIPHQHAVCEAFIHFFDCTLYYRWFLAVKQMLFVFTMGTISLNVQKSKFVCSFLFPGYVENDMEMPSLSMKSLSSTMGRAWSSLHFPNC